MGTSLLLDTRAWDLCIDANGDIAVCSEPYAAAQDAACHILLFSGELYYDTSQGVPYWRDILGHWPAINVVKAELSLAALDATGVETAQAYVTSLQHRVLKGVVVVTDAVGRTAAAAF